MNRNRVLDLAIEKIIDLVESKEDSNKRNKFDITSREKKLSKEEDIIIDNYYILGKVLALSYFCNAKRVQLKDIYIEKNKVRIPSFSNSIMANDILFSMTKASDIAKLLLKESVASVYFLKEIIGISDEKLIALKDGFIRFYNGVILLKSEILTMMTPYLSKLSHNNVMMQYVKVRDASIIELSRQMDIVDMIFKGINVYEEESQIQQLLINPDCDPDLLVRLADKLIEKSIIGYYEGEIEITWINIKNGEIVAIDYQLDGGNMSKIYLLLQISNYLNKSYYGNVAIQAIRPIKRYYYTN